MYTLAVVEDSSDDYAEMGKLLDAYFKQHKIYYQVKRFSNAIDFLDKYKHQFDAVFMDIDMHYMNGIEAAERLREKDKYVPLVFVTNLAKYAINGYDVAAFDFILKPLTERAFFIKMDRLMRHIAVMKNHTDIRVLGLNGTTRRIQVDSLLYIEVRGHHLYYYLADEVVEAIGSLKDLEALLLKSGFYRCNHCYLVNIRYVTAIDGDYAVVNGNRLAISRSKKKTFCLALAEHIGSMGVSGN